MIDPRPAALALAVTLGLLPFPATPAAAAADELRACWLTQYAYLGKTEAQLRAIAQNIKAGGMNTVYVAMYSGQATLWPSAAYQAAGGTWLSPNLDYADLLVDLFHDEGLKVGAWFEYGLAAGFASHPVAVAHPDWLARDQGGDPVTGENGGFVFLSPGHPDATAMIVEMARELAANYAFDDIQLDRLRWGRKTTGREYGYETVTAAKYQAQYGAPPPGNVNDATWVAFREGLVNDVVERCYDAIKAANPTVTVSSAPTGSYGIVQHMQRWRDWLDGGYMDLVVPQMYLTSLSAFQSEFQTQLAEAGPHQAKLGVGYRAQGDNDAALVLSQLNHARANGVPHACLWVYHTYTNQVAIQDEIDAFGAPGGVWSTPTDNPFASDDNVQVLVDDGDGVPAYQETGGGWASSIAPTSFRGESRLHAGGAAATASFAATIAKTGAYDVFAWYVAAFNSNPQALYTVTHAAGSTPVTVDQRQGGGAWVKLGRYAFSAGALAPRVTLSTNGALFNTFTSADAVRLVYAPAALPRLGLAHRATVSLTATSSAGSSFIGTHPSAVAWDGVDLYVAGFNNGSGQQDVGIVRVAQAASGAPAIGAAFGLVKTPGQRGYSGLDVRGSALLAAYDDGAVDANGISAWTTGGAAAWTRAARGSSGVAFDPGFPGGNPALGDGAAWTTFGADRRALQDDVSGADVWTTADGMSLASSEGTFWRAIDFDDARGDAWLREGNNVIRARRGGDNATTAVDVVVDVPDADAVNGQNVAWLDLGGAGAAIYNDRATTASGQPATTVIRAVDAAGTPLEIAWSGASLPAGNGYYAFAYHAPSRTLAILDFQNRACSIWDVTAPPFLPYGQGCPGSGGAAPRLSMSGSAQASDPVALTIDQGLAGAAAVVLLGLGPGALPMGAGCSLLVAPLLPLVLGPLPLSADGPGAGSVALSTTLPPSASGAKVAMQAFVADPGGALGFAASNGLFLQVP